MLSSRTIALAGRTFTVALLAAACAPPLYVSESDAIHFQESQLGTSTGQMGFTNGDALLVNTPVCPELDWGAGPVPSGGPEGVAPLDCAVDTLTGATWDGDCFVADASGEVVWSFDLSSCESDTLPDADAFRLPVVASEDVAGVVDFWPEDVVAELKLVPVGDVDTPLLPAPHTPIRVLADTPTGFDVRLFSVNPDDSTRRVAFRVNESQWSIGDGATVAWVDPGYGQATVPAGVEVSLGLVVDGHTFDAGHLLGTPADDVVSLSLVGWQGDDDTLTGPLGARAVGRTASGEPVFGLPVEWSVVKGVGAISPGLYGGQSGYATVGDECTLPSERGGDRTLKIRARWRDLSATAEFAWEGVAGTAEDDAEFVPSELCDRGCGCASAPSSAVGGVWLTGLVALVARRRRSAR